MHRNRTRTIILLTLSLTAVANKVVSQEPLLPARCGNEPAFIEREFIFGQLECADVIPDPSCPDLCNDPDTYVSAQEAVPIDVLHLYTPELASIYGIDGISNLVADWVDETNDYFFQSGALVQLRSVGVEPVPFGLGDDELAEQILSNLALSSDVRAMRNELSADIVGLLMPLVNDIAGPVCGKVRKVMMRDSLGPQFANSAYHITVTELDGCNRTYAHETGHLLGLRHDQCAENAPSECGVFCFSFAYADPMPMAFRTIMATNLTCEVAGAGSPPCYRIGYFSNRHTEYDDRPMWEEGISETARVINITAPIVANFRPENDNFIKRHILSGFDGGAASNNDGATHETDEPFHGGTANQSVWWEWTAPESGDVSFDSGGSSFPSFLAIYTGPTLNTLDPVEDEDTALDVVTFEAIGNVTYLIAVDSEMDETGDVELTWDLAPGSADLAVSLVADREVVGVGDTIIYTATISNSGPYWATNVTLEDMLDPSLEFVFADILGSPFSDDCTETDGTINCLVEIFPDTGETLNVLIGAEALTTGTISNTVAVEAIEMDPVASNDSATVEILAANPSSADLEVDLAVLSDPVNVGDPITWLVNVRNNGPANATGVVLTDVLPASVSFVSTNMPEICVEDSGTVTCQIGALENGTKHPTIEIVATANEGGTVINAVDLSGDETDPRVLNNTSQDSVAVVNTIGDFETKILPSNGASGPKAFGWSAAFDEHTVVVGSRADQAYIFDLTNKGWTEKQILSPVAPEGNIFGHSVDIEGSIIAVGAPGRGPQGSFPGSVHVFQQNGIEWAEKQKITAHDKAAGSYFGSSIAIDGDTLVVGAERDSRMGDRAGAAYVYRWDGIEWIEQQKLVASDPNLANEFGNAVAIEGDLIVVGSHWDDSPCIPTDICDYGSAYIFRWNGSQWVESQKLRSPALPATRDFGYSLALHSGKIAVGAPLEVVDGRRTGVAYLFGFDGDAWVSEEIIVANNLPHLAYFGHSLSLSDSLLIVGAFKQEAAYTYQNKDNSWIEIHQLSASDSSVRDYFGSAVAVDNNIVIVGAPEEDEIGVRVGAAYIYDLSALPTPSITVASPSTSASFSSGDSLSIEWTSTNTDPTDSIVLAMKRDIVPPSVTEPDGIDWYRFTLDTPNDGIETVTIPADVAFASDWRFYARHVESGAFDGTDVTFDIVAPPETDLSVTLADTPDPIQVGQQITYTIEVTNNGPDDATGVTVTNVLPSEVSFVSVNHPGVCSESAGTVTCSIGNLASSTLFPDIEVIVTANELGTIINAVDLSGAEPDPDPLNNTAQVSTTVNAVADLSVTLTDTPDPIQVGQQITYTIEVTNNGPDDATGVTVTNVLPSEVSFVSVNHPGVCSENAGTVACTIGSLPSDTAFPTIEVIVTANEVGTIINAVDLSGAEPDPEPLNNTAQTITTVTAAADVVVSTSDSIDPVMAGEGLEYTVTVINNGPSDAADVSVTQTLPTGAMLSSTAGCGEDPMGVPACTLGLVAAGSQKLVTVVVAVDSGATNTLVYQAVATSSTPEASPGDESAIEETAVATAADLAITKIDDADPVIAGTELTYTIAVGNAGPSDAQAVRVIDVLPEGTTLISTTGCTQDPVGIPECSLGTIMAGGQRQYLVTVEVDSTASGTITNEASVASDTPESNPGNESTSESTLVDTRADLQVLISDLPDPALVGENITYTLTINNDGPSEATGVVLTNSLPANTTFVSSTPDECSEEGGVVTCQLGSLPHGQSTIVTMTVTANSAGTLTNTASVSSSTVDPDSENNSSEELTTVVLPEHYIFGDGFESGDLSAWSSGG